MSRPNPYQITAFTQAARSRSFSQAAVTIGVTQSSITQHVAKLEQSMGVQLFVRRRNGLELTQSGRELFAVTDRWLTIDEQISEQVENYTALDGGHLRITATAPRPALPIIAQFNRLYPKVQIEFSLFNWTQNSAMLKKRDVDISFMTDPKIDDSLSTEKIEDVRYLAFVRYDHRLARRNSISLKELVNEAIIVPEDGSLTQRIFFNAASENSFVFPNLIKMTTFAVVKEAILHGLGIGLLLEDSVSQTDRLIGLEIKELPQRFGNYVVVPTEKRKLRLIKRFLELV